MDRRRLKLAMLFGLVFPFVLPPLVRSADHKDAPLISEDKALDLLDFFAFVSPTDNSKVILAGTVNGFTVPGELSVGFAQNALYEFKIDNDGDYVEDVVVQATFSKIGGNQLVTVRGPAEPSRTGAASHLLPDSAIRVVGAANATILSSDDNSIHVFAGLRDDPFYTDLIWVLRLIGAVSGGPLERANGIDFFAGLNCSVLAVEVPRDLLTGADGNNINVWGTTSRPKAVKNSTKRDPGGSGLFVQVERTAAPVVNTVIHSLLTGKVAAKDRFNRTPPSKDVKDFRNTAIDAIVAIGILNPGQAAGVVDAVLIPDVLHLDVTDTSGFPNGRRPQDDVINAVLNAASNGMITDDGVESNDAAFLAVFPFFALPHTLFEGVPPRDAAP